MNLPVQFDITSHFVLSAGAVCITFCTCIWEMWEIQIYGLESLSQFIHSQKFGRIIKPPLKLFSMRRESTLEQHPESDTRASYI